MERKIKGYRYCRTNGTVSLQGGDICSDPECSSCKIIRNVFKREVNRLNKTLGIKFKDSIKPLSKEEKKKYNILDKKFSREEVQKAVNHIFRGINDESKSDNRKKNDNSIDNKKGKDKREKP